MFLNFYQNLPQQIDPIAFSLGSLSVGWYGLMWLAAFVCVYFLLLWRISAGEESGLTKNFNKESLQDLIFASLIGAVIGGRLGYVLFYDIGFYAQHPLSIISPYDFAAQQWTGIAGMSYHGGALGVIVAVLWFARKKNMHFFQLIDFIIPAVPLGYFFGRIGNFLNGELFGRATQKPWGMHFDSVDILRHPSQLYEALGEGILIFAVLWFARNTVFAKKCPGVLALAYLFLYGVIRFIIEFYRLPDAHIGVNTLLLSRGQMLSLVIVIIAIIVYRHQRRKNCT